MVEKEQIKNSERNNAPLPKAVLILFPDIRTTGGQSGDQENQSFLYRDFRNTADKLLARYQRLGFTTVGIIYRDTDSETFSYLYPQSNLQHIIRWGQTFDDWENKGSKENQEFDELYKSFLPTLLADLNLQDNADVIVGGYHAKDCVAKFAAYLRQKGFKAKVDIKLTDQLPFLLISHRIKRNLPEGMKKEHVQIDRVIWEIIKKE